MSALEFLYLLGAFFVVSFSIFCLFNFGDDFVSAAFLVPVYLFLGLVLYLSSSLNSPLRETYSRPAEIVSQFETPKGMLIYYKNFLGETEEVRFESYSDVNKIKNGGILHLTALHSWVNFGSDRNETGTAIK